jgi:serine/threonine protein kinase
METVLCRRPDTVVYLADKLVYKTCSTAATEAATMRRLADCQPHVCPAVISHNDVVFAMELGQDSRGVGGLDLRELTTDLFWAVFQLYEHDVVHSDIKPSNVVLLGGKYCLIDFDAAVDLGTLARRRYSAAFSSSDLLVEKSAADWDMVSRPNNRWRRLDWNVDSRYRWGTDMIFRSSSVLRRAGVVPESGTAPCLLVHPNHRMDMYCALKEGCKDAVAWIDRVRKLEKEKSWPVCPPEILERWFEKKRMQSKK